jgi:hypothetical protein
MIFFVSFVPLWFNFSFVIPAEAGIHASAATDVGTWIPACAGMTIMRRALRIALTSRR